MLNKRFDFVFTHLEATLAINAECQFLVTDMDTGAVQMFGMPGTAKMRLTVHIYKSRCLRVRNYNGCKIYFNSFLAQS